MTEFNALLDEEINHTTDSEIKEECRKIKLLLENYEKTDETVNNLKDYPLVVDCLSKEYNVEQSEEEKKRRKRALNNFSILLNQNEIFGLLGPNGAGKTTFFSLLTGIYSPTSGNAWVSGESILSNVAKVQESIGYCPQFDVLWAELTVEEHLYFYSKLKNVSSDKIEGIVENVLNKTLLTPYKTFLVKELSGGMKRRLSLGISIVGEPLS